MNDIPKILGHARKINALLLTNISDRDFFDVNSSNTSEITISILPEYAAALHPLRDF